MPAKTVKQLNSDIKNVVSDASPQITFGPYWFAWGVQDTLTDHRLVVPLTCISDETLLPDGPKTVILLICSPGHLTSATILSLKRLFSGAAIQEESGLSPTIIGLLIKQKQNINYLSKIN